jgi:hypothetical protein
MYAGRMLSAPPAISLRSLQILAVALLTALLALMLAPGAQAATAKPGTVVVQIVTPKNVPARVALKGKTTRVAAKAPRGTSYTSSLRLPAGTYKVIGVPMTYHGLVYQLVAVKSVKVLAGKKVKLKVRVRLAKNAPSHLEANATKSGVALTWSQGRGTVVKLMRTASATPATLPTQGTQIKVGKGAKTALDAHAAPGKTYSYALFARSGKTWLAPLTVTLMTPDASGSGYIAAPDTFIISPAKMPQVTVLANAVRLAAPAGSNLQVGSGLVLPDTAEFPGGLLGAVTAISADGRSVDVAPSSLGALFEVFSADIQFDKMQVTSSQVAAPAPHALSRSRVRSAAGSAPASGCEVNGAGEDTVVLSPLFDASPHLTLKHNFRKHKVRFGPDYIAGSKMNATFEMKAKAGFGLEGEISSAYECSHSIKFTAEAAVGFVPFTVVFEPKAEVSGKGAFTIRDAKLAGDINIKAEIDVDLGKALDLRSPVSFDKNFEVKSDIDLGTITGSGSVSAALGGDLTVAPGIGSQKFGIIAGIKGSLEPMKLNAQIAAAVDGSPCVSLTTTGSSELYMTARAWAEVAFAPNFDFEEEFKLTGKSWDWSGAPSWSVPEGCTAAPVDPGPSGGGGGTDPGTGGGGTDPGTGGGGTDPGPGGGIDPSTGGKDASGGTAIVTYDPTTDRLTYTDPSVDLDGQIIYLTYNVNEADFDYHPDNPLAWMFAGPYFDPADPQPREYFENGSIVIENFMADWGPGAGYTLTHFIASTWVPTGFEDGTILSQWAGTLVPPKPLIDRASGRDAHRSGSSVRYNGEEDKVTYSDSAVRLDAQPVYLSFNNPSCPYNAANPLGSTCEQIYLDPADPQPRYSFVDGSIVIQSFMGMESATTPTHYFVSTSRSDNASIISSWFGW